MVGVIILENNKIIFFIFLQAVERCSCPQGYEGLSCQECSYGYTRVNNTIYKGKLYNTPWYMGILGLTLLFITVDYIVHLGILVY